MARGAGRASGRNELSDELPALLARLRASGKPRDALVGSLKGLATVLEHAPQDTAVLGSSGSDLAAALAAPALLTSRQPDVRMYTGTCLANLLRIYAPATPYEDVELEARHRHEEKRVPCAVPVPTLCWLLLCHRQATNPPPDCCC